MNRTRKILTWIVGLLAVLLLAAFVAIQIPAVQTALGKRVIASIEKKTDAQVSFSSISVRPLQAILLEDFVMRDTHPLLPQMDTLLHVKHLSVKFSLRGLLKGRGAYVSRLRLSGGGFFLVMEPDSTRPGRSITNIQRILHLSPGEETKEAGGWGKILTAKSVQVLDFTFRMENVPAAERRALRGVASDPGVIDWNHLYLTLHEGHFQNLKIADNLIACQSARVNLQERETGLHFKELTTGAITVGNALARIEDIYAQDSFSYLHLDHFAMEGALDNYDLFEDRVVIDGVVRDGSLVDMGNTIGHFASLRGISFRGYLKGRVHGTVNNLGFENVTIQDADNGVVLSATGSIRDVVEVERSLLDFNVRELSFTLDGLSGFVKAWAPGVNLNLHSIAPGERLRFQGTLKGPMEDMNLVGEFNSDIGQIVADAYLRNVLDGKQSILLGGKLSTTNLHLGKVLGISALGPLSMRTTIGSAIRPDGGIDVKLDTLQVSRLQALGYDYSQISARATYENESFRGGVISNDPNLKLRFRGRLDLAQQVQDAVYKFGLDVDKADLHALQLDKREVSALSFHSQADFIRPDALSLEGQVNLQDLVLESAEGRKLIGNVDVSARQKDGTHLVNLNSSFLEAAFKGSEPIFSFVQDLKDISVNRELPVLLEEPAATWKGASYDVSLKVLDAQDVLTFLMPGLYVENKTQAHLQIDSDGTLSARVNSGRLAIYEKFIKDFKLDANNLSSALSATLEGGTLAFGDTRMKDNRIQLKASDNLLSLSYSFDNEDKGKNHGRLDLQAQLSRPSNQELSVLGQVLPSSLCFNGTDWDLSSGNILYQDGDIQIDRLLARHQLQSLLVDGGLREGKADTLTVRMDKFDLAIVNALTGSQPELEGLATGQALILSPTQPSFGLIAGILCDNVLISGKPFGTVQMASNWDEESQRFVASVTNLLNGKSTLDANAFLVPETRQVQARAQLKDLDMEYAKPFLQSLFCDFAGSLSGVLTMDGTLDKLHFGSENLQVSDGLLTLDFTRVPYRVNGGLTLNDEGLFFTTLQMEDGEEGTGVLEGGLLFKNIRDIGLDTHVRCRNMHVLNMGPEQSSSFYGNLYATGKVDVTGSLSSILLDIEATTRGGQIHIPLGTMSGDRSRELLTFTDPASKLEKDPYELMMAAQNQNQSNQSALDVMVRVHATPDATVFIDVDNESSLMGTGQGDIDIVNRSKGGDFTLNGDYTLNSGNFHFSAMNLVSRNFTIQDGSSVRFTGDLWNTDLNVKGLYVTKASLYNLTADETATTRRTVNCGINISGKLQNPEVDFSIEVPDLNPTTQAQVQGALNTEDKIQKQFIYLLVAGSFLPSEESGISVGGTDVLYSNVSSIMSGQLNNIFQQLNIPLDLGLNYKSTQSGNSIFDVAVSTQLFNNRVVVNGTVGNKEQLGGTTTNEVAGDIDVEIKLNRSGSLRLNLFTHSADQLSSYLDNSQRHGGGMTYQRDFNSFRQFFKDLFSGRKQREQRALEDARTPSRSVRYQIDSNGKAQRYDLR